MRKEVVYAVIIGVILGGIILYGINLANTSSRPTSEQEIQKPSASPTQTQTTGNTISVIAPQNHSVIVETQTLLKGSTKPNSNVAIVTENDDILTMSDANGNFSSTINLINGENTINITSVDTNQATSSASLSVIHTDSLPE